jgi:hypothetical protein
VDKGFDCKDSFYMEFLDFLLHIVEEHQNADPKVASRVIVIFKAVLDQVFPFLERELWA